MVVWYSLGGVAVAYSATVGWMLRHYGKRLEANLARGATSSG